MLKKIMLLIVLLCATTHINAEPPLTLELQNVNLPDALRIIAKFLKINLVMSSAVSGNITLHLDNATPHAAFDLLLNSQGLTKTQQGDIIYVAPRAELLARRQDDAKIQEAYADIEPLHLQTWQINYAKADDIARLLQDSHASMLSARGQVRIDTRTNVLFVQDTATKLAQVRTLLKKLDVPVRQIRIKARLASVDSDFERELGISFSAHDARNLATTLPHHFSLAVANLADGSFLDVALAAMENAGKGELISSPSLFTANQQTALIESGEEIPYQEVSLSGGTAVTFKKAVLSLKVTPQILPNDKVLLRLQVNEDRPSNRIVQGVPAIRTRLILTNVLVKSGQTLVLGGIYELNQENDVERVPILGKIPGIGLLFRQQTTKISKRELLVFVTPEIIA
jgi:type IV pilus assembly protein PilQ